MKKKRIISLFLVLATVLTLGAVSVSAADGDLGKLTVKKEIDWDPANPGEATVTVTTNVPTVKETQVLFVGTLCSAHSMEKNTIINSINAIAQNADVNFYLLDIDTSDSTAQITKSGTVKRYATMESTGTDYDDFSLASRKHAAFKGFVNVLNTELGTDPSKLKYDYVVMEFDASRLAAYESGKEYLPSSATVKSVATVLQEYYKQNRVIWITDGRNHTAGVSSGSTDRNKKYASLAYTPTNIYYFGSKDEQKLHLTTKQFHYLCAVVAPSYYLTYTTENSTNYGDGSKDFTLSSDYSLKLGERTIKDELYGKAPDYLVYSEDSRQMYYTDANELSDFLYMAIKGVTLKFTDNIKAADGLEVTQVTISANNTDDSETGWVQRSDLTVTKASGTTLKPGDKVENTSKEITVSVGEGSTNYNQVTANAVDMKSAVKQVKMVVKLKATDGFQSCITRKLDDSGNPAFDDQGRPLYIMNPNNGPAEVSAYQDGGISSGTSVATGEGTAIAATVNTFTVDGTVKNGSQDYDEDSQKGEITTPATAADNELQVTTFESDTAS